MFIVIGGMLDAVALFFLIFVEDGGFETGLFLLAFTVLLFVISRVTTVIERRRALAAPREAFITHAGIMYEGTVYPIRAFLLFMDGVSFRMADNPGPATLGFPFTQLIGRFIIQPFDVVVPVPEGEEETARRIVNELGSGMPGE